MLNDTAKSGVNRYLALQGVLIVVMASIMFGAINYQAAYSALLGGLTCLIPTWVFAKRYFKYRGARRAQQIVAAFYRGEAIKLVLTVILFTMIFKFVTINAMSFFVTFIVVQAMAWMTPLLFN